jgi:hypothetical protein
MTGPPGRGPATKSAPPTKRADMGRIPVRLHDGALIANVHRDMAERLLDAGVADGFCRGPRYYVRLRQGITIPQTESCWDIIEFLRQWHGDKKAAGYLAHRDLQSEHLRYEPPSPDMGGRSGAQPIERPGSGGSAHIVGRDSLGVRDK